MKTPSFLIAFLAALFLASCAPKEQATSGKPHATVLLRDGTQVSGSLLANSNTEVQIAGDDNITRTIPTSQVKSINYDEPPAPGANPPAGDQAPQQAAPAPAAPAAAPAQRAARPAAPARVPPPPPPPVAHQTHEHPTEAAITTRTFELPAGTELSIRTEDTIDSAKAVEGQTYEAEVTNDVLDAEGATVIPRGANAQIVIVSASQGGRIRGASDLVLDLKSVTVDGREYEISTTDVTERGKPGIGANKRTAEHVGGGAAIGAIIGAIAGGGKGAAIGAGAGAGAGAIAQVLTKGGAIRVPAETILTFKLDKPLRVSAARK